LTNTGPYLASRDILKLEGPYMPQEEQYTEWKVSEIRHVDEICHVDDDS
jgi:hypothetical protein